MDFRLYIKGQECDLNDTFAVQLSYTAEDTESPSAVITEYSKTVTLPRTGNNDLIFNFIGDLDRVQDNETTYFNPLERIPMLLTYKGSTVLEGYAKLENISNDSYSVTLYSGVADFFYSFSTDTDGDTFTIDRLRFETDLDFDITKETVNTAWQRLKNPNKTGTNKWDTINFAPMYNGLPEDIDAGKALINISGSSVFTASTMTSDGNTYETYQDNMLALSSFSDEHTEWEIGDLRSYCQRPVLNVKKFFEAIQTTAYEKGFILNLDEGFFNNLNPYYSKTWLTMPMLTQLETDGQTWTGRCSSTYTEDVKPKTEASANVIFTGQLNGTEVSLPDVNGKSNLNIKFSLSADVNYSGSELYTGFLMHNYNSTQTGNTSNDSYNQNNNSGIVIQFIVKDVDNDAIIAASPTYTLSSLIDGQLKKYPSYVGYGSNQEGIAGTFKNNSGRWEFTGLGGNTEFDAVVEDIPRVNNMSVSMVVYSYATKLYRDNEYWLDTLRKGEEIKTLRGHVNDGDLIFTSFGKTGSNAHITARMMFSNMGSVADYMIGFSKMFGLKWLQEGKTINLMTRNRYYTKTINDYSDDSDRSNIKTEPLTHNKRYYDLKNDADETYFTEKYKRDWGAEYGRQRVDTGYKFDSDVEEFFKDLAYKGGVYGKMKSNYYRHIKGKNWNGMSNREWIPSPILDKITYSLVKNGNDPDDTKDIEVGMDVIKYINYSPTARYDCNDRMCFADSSDGAVDGDSVLLFYNGYKEQKDANGFPIDYMLTDDLEAMFALNGDNATWLITSTEFDTTGKRIAYKYDALPDFGRYYTDGTNSIVLSMDMGEPKELYCDLASNPNTTIYSRFWKRYLIDQMNVDARKINVPLLYRAGMDAQTLRDFIKIDNQVYMLNSADYNVGTTGLTDSELIKINDVYNYTQGQTLIYPEATLTVSPTSANVAFEGGLLRFDVVFSNLTDIYIKTDSPWLSGYMNGDIFMVNVETNKEAERNGHIWLVGRDYGGNDIVSDAIGIVQEKFIYLDPVLTITPTTGKIDRNGGEMTFNVQAENVNNVRFASNSEWITGSIVGNLLKINVAVNSGEERNGNIWLEAIDLRGDNVKSNEVAITQEKYVKQGSNVLMFTTTDGNTWSITQISAYTADNRLIEPIEKTSTGWTYGEDVAYIRSHDEYKPSENFKNLKTYTGFKDRVKYNECFGLFLNDGYCTSINTANFDVSECVNMRNMFLNCTGLTSLDVSNWNTSQVTNMAFMFTNCRSLITLNVSNFDTSKVTDMSWMFNYCSGLTSLDVSKFNTLKVTDMVAMFAYCKGLTSLDLSHFNTSKVTNMIGMFEGCSGLITLDLSNWNTSQVTGMVQMFSDCSGLTSLNVSHFDTSNVIDMGYMFENCSGLTSLDVSQWNTSKVTNMESMFRNCKSLASLDVSNWNTSQVMDTNSMFSGCTSLTSLDVSNFDTSKVTDISDMFSGCKGLTSLDVSNFNTSQVTDMAGMFSYCRLLTSLDVSNFNTSKVTRMNYMFRDCKGLTSLDVSNFNTSQVTDMAGMFSGCKGLTSIDVSNFNTSKVGRMSSVFWSCSGLTSLDVSNWDTSKAENMGSMFANCKGLTSLDLSNFDTSKVNNMGYMFSGCTSLTSLDLSNWDTTKLPADKVVNMISMFNGCTALKTITMKNCNQATIDKIKSALQDAGILNNVTIITA